MVCPRCKMDISDDSKVCSWCGKDFDGSGKIHEFASDFDSAFDSSWIDEPVNTGIFVKNNSFDVKVEEDQTKPTESDNSEIFPNVSKISDAKGISENVQKLQTQLKEIIKHKEQVKKVDNDTKRRCPKCNNGLKASYVFCANCGYSVKDEQNNKKSEAKEEKGNKIEEKSISDNDRAIAMLAYLGFLIVVPIIKMGKNRFLRFHANQGLVCLVSFIILSVVNALATEFRAYGTISIINTSIIILVVIDIIGLVSAIAGQQRVLPLIGKIKMIK